MEKRRGEAQKKRRGKIKKSAQNGLQKSSQNIRNPYQIEDTKTQGGGPKRRPLGAAPKALLCCLQFGKDFLCFGLISGAHSWISPVFFSVISLVFFLDFPLLFLLTHI